MLHLCCVHKITSLVCLALTALTSCSRQKTMSRDELQSNLRSAESLAAETSTFIDYVRQNRATDQYAKGHAEYLLSAVGRIATELHQARPPADGAPESRKAVRKWMLSLRSLASYACVSVTRMNLPANSMELPLSATPFKWRFPRYEKSAGAHAGNHDGPGRLR